MQRQLSQLQRHMRRQSRDEQLCGLTPRAQLVCLAIYILSGFQMEVAEAFVQDARKRRKRILSEGAMTENIPTKIRTWFRECPLERLYQLQVPETECSRDQILHQEAVKYISKFHTAKWIADQNYKHSLAPTYDALVNKYREELAKHGSGHVADRLVLSTDGRVGAAGRTARAWCGRFCAQFAVARKRLAVGSEMPAAEFEEKAV